MDMSRGSIIEATKTIDWSTILTILFSVDMLIIGIAALFHILGVILIVSKSSEMSNQSILLVHLSLTSFVALATNIYAVHHITYDIVYSQIFIVLFYIAYISYILNLTLLTLDRLLMAFLNIQYQTSITKFKVYISLSFVWLIAIGYGMIIRYAPFFNRTVVKENASFIYNGFVVIFTTISYIAITIKVKISAIEVHSAQLIRESSKKYIIPLFIVISFLLLNMLPAIIEVKVHKMLNKLHNQYLTIGLIGANCLNNLLDPVIYIFLQHSIRKRLKKIIRKCFKKCYTSTVIDEETLTENVKRSKKRFNTGTSTSSSTQSSVQGSL